MTGGPEPVRDRFTAGEWTALTDAPLLAAMMVLAAGRRGSVRGTIAVARAYAAARERESPPLVTEIVTAGAPRLRERVRDREALAGQAPAALRSAAALLARSASAEERDAYRRLVLDVAAAAAGRGGQGRSAALEQVSELMAGA